MSECEITIEKMAYGGAGLGHVAGKVCFVPFTAPGDRARIRVSTEKRSYLEGEMIELLTSSPFRVPPPCPVFTTCGGCNWQHLSYPAQLAAKQEIFADLLWRAGRVERQRVLPIVSAPATYGYRSRVQFKVCFFTGVLQLGFYRAGSHNVVDIPEQCAIAQPVINLLFPELRDVLTHAPEPDKIPQIDVTAGDTDSAVLIFHYTGARHRELAEYLGEQKDLPAAGLYIQIGRKSSLQRISGVEALRYHVSGNLLPEGAKTNLTFAPGGFSQVNYQQNSALINTVCAWAELTGTEKILDLYCGNGNFSIPLARSAASVTGIEEYAPSIRDARQNCALNGISNASYRCADAVAGLLRLKEAGERYDIIILDPPRAGAPELVRHLPSLMPAKIIYISCDPATLARDVGILRKSGYEVIKSQPVDMFPQTYHIESVTLFEPAATAAV
jgi:23S rRNA (uracil1939-C5)-methyltransferase